MIKNKRGQGLSINVIIIAAIALLVLIVLAVLVARSGGHVSDGTKCIEKGGLCKTTFCPGNQVSGTNLCPTEQTCCNIIPRD